LVASYLTLAAFVGPDDIWRDFDLGGSEVIPVLNLARM
jgi:hypothetical protein